MTRKVQVRYEPRWNYWYVETYAHWYSVFPTMIGRGKTKDEAILDARQTFKNGWPDGKKEVIEL